MEGQRLDGGRAARPGLLVDGRAHQRGVAREHLKRGRGQHTASPRAEQCPADTIQCLVGARRHQHHSRRHAVALGDGRLELLRLRVAAHGTGIDRGELRGHVRRQAASLGAIQSQVDRRVRRRRLVGAHTLQRRHRPGPDGRGRSVANRLVAHGTIWFSAVTTMSVPPRSFRSGMRAGSSSRGTAAFTA